MKIRTRILLINFITVFIIVIVSVSAFYSIMHNVLTSKQSQYLLNSANNFVYAFQSQLKDASDDVRKFSLSPLKQFSPKAVDFILKKVQSTKDLYSVKFSVNSNKLISKTTLKQFSSINPYLYVQKYKTQNGDEYYYGQYITSDFLTLLSKRIGSDIALIWQDFPSVVSSNNTNQKHLYALKKVIKKLKNKSNFYIVDYSSKNEDMIATVYRSFLSNSEIRFLIFNSVKDVSRLRSNINELIILIGLTGIILALILTMLFTNKLRNQISILSDAAILAGKGGFRKKININSKDEIGDLANAFNKMLFDLEKSEKATKEYTDFLTLLNKNPTLKELSEATLIKIIEKGNFDIGALYNIEENDIELVSSYGISEKEILKPNTDFLKTVLKSKEIKEITFEENPPSFSIGLVSLKIKHFLLIPIIYNNKVIGIIELGSSKIINEKLKEYFSTIQQQLAIGLTNANAREHLGNLVAELKNLNNDFQKQNEQVKKQNNLLLNLHEELKEKAGELEVQKEKAEEATKIKSQFLASMSHELRTPLNSILGLTELIIENSSLSERDLERLKVVLKSGKRLLMLINDVLDLSKIEAGKMDVNIENILLFDLITEIEASLKPLFDNKDILFKINNKTNTKVLIKTDGHKVFQVLINLLGNAVKFTKQGMVELSVNIIDNNLLEFEVIDTGVGISEEDIKIIFEEFRQVDGSNTRKHSGTGLGLTISNKLVKLLGGSLSVSSKLNVGTQFTFSLPIEIIEINQLSKQSETNTNIINFNNKKSILIIDDDKDVCFTIGNYLNNKGYNVIYADDGEIGINKAIEQKPFVIILDIAFQQRDGWPILSELKNNYLTQDIPVIVISIDDNKKVGFGLGASDYLVKPITYETLKKTFDRFLNESIEQNKNIVIVDDDDLEFERFKSEFKNDNIKINYIKDSSLAFNQILETQPDLIILDLMMPNIDGITLAEKLKSNNLTKNIPIIISTSKNLTDEERVRLTNIVENIASKSKQHPLDVLKIVRDKLVLLEKMKKKNNKNTTDKTEVVNEKRDLSNAPEILIVDDDTDTLFTINELVESCGCNTILAKNGIECLDILKKSKPDLILLDIMMPEMDGFQTIHEIRKNLNWKNITVFAVTAKAMEEDRQIILNQGFNDYIPKPVDPMLLTNKINSAIIKMSKTINE